MPRWAIYGRYHPHDCCSWHTRPCTYFLIVYLFYCHELCKHSNEYPQLQKHATSSCNTTINTHYHPSCCQALWLSYALRSLPDISSRDTIDNRAGTPALCMMTLASTGRKDSPRTAETMRKGCGNGAERLREDYRNNAGTKLQGGNTAEMLWKWVSLLSHHFMSPVT